MGTRSFIIVENEGQFSGVYCHWDGYLENNGAILLKHYQTAKAIKPLIEGGDMSILMPKLEDCTFYRARGDKWENVKPTECDTFEEFSKIAEGSGCEFIYVFQADGGGWFYAERGPQFFGLGDGSDFTALKPLTPAAVQAVSSVS